jgi:CHAD domain-containing protein
MTPHPDLLDLPASEGARTVVLGLLAEARERAGRIAPPGQSFGAAVAARIREQARAVTGFLARVETLDDTPLAHRARIRGKRLRYLVEPLRDAPGAPAALEARGALGG